MMLTMKHFIVVAVTLSTLMGRAKADIGVLRGFLEEEGGNNDFVERMSAAAAKQSARHLLRKWLLKPEDVSVEQDMEVKKELKIEEDVVVEEKMELHEPVSSKGSVRDVGVHLRPALIPIPAGYVPPSANGRFLLPGDPVVGVVEEYFVPMAEQKLIEKFVELSDGVGGAIEAECEGDDPATDSCTDVNTFIAVTASFDNTIVFWDHFEDDYESSCGERNQETTEIWGDENCTNGFRPDMYENEAACLADGAGAGSKDVLNGGDSVVINNIIPLPRDESADPSLYDGGDHVCANSPIKLVRGGYAESTGPLLAGAVEVYRVAAWGTYFVSPVGEDTLDTPAKLDPFNSTSLYIMASEDGTDILRDGIQVATNLAKGTTYVINDVNQGTKINTTAPVQVHLLTGEVGPPYYELRWYSLQPFDDWSNEYITPVGVSDTTKFSRIWVYNPGTAEIVVSFEGVTGALGNLAVPGNTALRTTFDIPDGSGARVFTDNEDDKFFSMTQTDIEIATGNANKGQRQDWGHPLVATKDLTAQATVGYGQGCPQQKDNPGVKCSDLIGFTGDPPPVSEKVFVTAVEDATIYVDYDGDGLNPDQVINVTKLESVKIFDEEDNDMSGALVWAVEQGEGTDSSKAVLIALAWGQDPLATDGVEGLDAGNVIFNDFQLDPSKDYTLVEDLNMDGKVNPGEVLNYTITVFNNAVTRFYKGRLGICDDLPDEVDYVNGTAMWAVLDSDDNYLDISEDEDPVYVRPVDPVNGNLFDCNDPWFLPVPCPPRGAKVKVWFEAQVDGAALDLEDDELCKEILNEGEIVYKFDRAERTRTFEKEADVCAVCKNTETNGTDLGCNTTYPVCNCEPFGCLGTVCEAPIPGTTPAPKPEGPPCNPTLCEACIYFCGHQQPYTCGEAVQTNFMDQEWKPKHTCRIHPFCGMCQEVCPVTIDDGEECPVGCPSDGEDNCPVDET